MDKDDLLALLATDPDVRAAVREAVPIPEMVTAELEVTPLDVDTLKAEVLAAVRDDLKNGKAALIVDRRVKAQPVRLPWLGRRST